MAASRHNIVKYQPEDFQFIRLYKCINHVGLKLIQMVFEWGLKLPTNETLKEYIMKKKDITHRAYKNRYDDDQRKLIDAYDVHNGDKFDVSIFYKLVQDTSYDIASTQDKCWYTKDFSQLEYLLYSTKCARNTISHKQMSLDKGRTQEIIEEYRNVFLNLVEAAGVRYGRDVTTERNNLEKDIDEIINFPLMENEIENLFREQIHERSKCKLVEDGAQEMKEKYKGWSELNPLTLLDGTNFRLPVMKVYKKLEIRDCGRHSKNILIDSNDVLRLNESYETVEDLKEAVDLVILEGPTGSGKTTITKLLLAEWSTNPKSLIKGLFDYHLLIYMECRNSNIESLSKLLQCLMPSTNGILEEDSTKTLSACKVLVIIDSLDEINEKSELLVKELLELIKMKNITGICTMRPTKVQEVFALLPSELKTVHLKSCGIPDDQRAPFVEMYHEELRIQGKSDQSTKELMQHLSKSSSRLQEHLRYPINLVHLVYLWAIAPQKVKFVTTATELYSSIHEVVQIKLADRLIICPLTKHLTKEKRKRQTGEFLEALYIEAMLNLTRQHYCNIPKDSEAKLKKVCEENSLPQDDMLSAFLVTKNIWTGLTMETEYGISHTDMQEYLAACCIFNAVKNHDNQIKIKSRIQNDDQIGNSRMDSLKQTFRNTLTRNPEPVTDVLKIFFPNSEIPLKGYQNLLKHLSGLFVVNNKTISRSVAKDLVRLFKKSGMERPEDWLDIYAETKSDKFMGKYLKELCGDMLSGDITVKDSHLAAYAILFNPKSSQPYHGDVVDAGPVVNANSLTIKLQNPSSELPDLKELMSHAVHLKCPVELHLYHNWRKPQFRLINDVLNEMNISCDLKVVRGSPSSTELRAASSTLVKLYISICDDDHAKDVLPILTCGDLPRLRAICIHLKCGEVSSEVLLPMKFSVATTICLFLSDVNDTNIATAVEIAQALQLPNGEYHCLYLPNNQLTSSGFVDLVERLHQNNVKILVHIGVTSDIIDEELDKALDEATAAASEHLNCKLLWYFNADRMEGW